MFPGHLIHLAAFHRCIIVIQIIELDLHDFNLRILRQDAVQDIRLIMETDAHMPDPAFFFQFKCCFISTAPLELVIICQALGMHQIKIEIIHTAPLQLFLEEWADILLFLKIRFRQFVRQQKTLPGIPARQAVPDRQFRFPVEIRMGRVKIIEA